MNRQQSSVALREDELIAGNADRPGLRGWCRYLSLTDDC